MQTVDYICDRYGFDRHAKTPITFRLSRHGPSGFISLLRDLGFKVGAEVGVEQGHYSRELLQGIPGLHLFSIDPWKAYSRYRDHVSQEKLDGFYHEATERLAGLNATVVRKTSLEAVQDFKAADLDFVYIDANHDFEYVVNDIIAWSKVVKAGGIVAGHDYRHEGKESPALPFGVIQATNAYTDAYSIRPWFVIRGDKSPSWFWVKPGNCECE